MQLLNLKWNQHLNKIWTLPHLTGWVQSRCQSHLQYVINIKKKHSVCTTLKYSFPSVPLHLSSSHHLYWSIYNFTVLFSLQHFHWYCWYGLLKTTPSFATKKNVYVKTAAVMSIKWGSVRRMCGSHHVYNKDILLCLVLEGGSTLSECCISLSHKMI